MKLTLTIMTLLVVSTVALARPDVRGASYITRRHRPAAALLSPPPLASAILGRCCCWRPGSRGLYCHAGRGWTRRARRTGSGYVKVLPRTTIGSELKQDRCWTAWMALRPSTRVFGLPHATASLRSAAGKLPRGLVEWGRSAGHLLR
jgi:hypothetical protein